MIFFEILLLVFLGAALFLILFMALYLLIRGQWRKKYIKWNTMIDLLIRKAIFFSEDSDNELKPVPITSRLQNTLANTRFRSRLRRKIVQARKSMSGQSAVNLKKLYLQLNMNQDALKMMRSNRWHLVASGLQQISLFQLREHLQEIDKFTHHSNELVRVEAQIAGLSMNGFEGLKFLDTITYQISEWQQMKLLKELSFIPHVNLTGIDNWLKSPNPSVIVFALKLARNYHHFELYDDIVLCLQHPEASVRLHAIYTLSDIFIEDTSKYLLKLFENENVTNQIAIMRAVGKIGDETDVPILKDFLAVNNLDVKLEVVRAIAKVSQEPLLALMSCPHADEYPLDEIILQIKGEYKL